jgi:DNA-binding NarL/FixJ family response regulator
MRILVADDHSLFRDGLVSLLEAAGFEVAGQAGDGAAAAQLASELLPDLVLLDITMPIMNGIQALKAIKSKQPQLQVVMLTVSDEEDDLLEAIQSGADGYLLKSLSAEEFVKMLRGIQVGEAAIGGKMAGHLIRQFHHGRRDAPDPSLLLTTRELSILRLVAAGLPNKGVAQELCISENTVKYHMKHILQKLDARNRTEAVTQAIQAGILTPSE